jgi:hypothetical protein
MIGRRQRQRVHICIRSFFERKTEAAGWYLGQDMRRSAGTRDGVRDVAMTGRESVDATHRWLRRR